MTLVYCLLVLNFILFLWLYAVIYYNIFSKIELFETKMAKLESNQNKIIRTSLQPNKKDIIRNYREAYPNKTKADCVRDTGISKPTVAKWWNVEKGE